MAEELDKVFDTWIVNVARESHPFTSCKVAVCVPEPLKVSPFHEYGICD